MLWRQEFSIRSTSAPLQQTHFVYFKKSYADWWSNCFSGELFGLCCQKIKSCFRSLTSISFMNIDRWNHPCFYFQKYLPLWWSTGAFSMWTGRIRHGHRRLLPRPRREQFLAFSSFEQVPDLPGAWFGTESMTTHREFGRASVILRLVVAAPSVWHVHRRNYYLVVRVLVTSIKIFNFPKKLINNKKWLTVLY